ncbi:MAG: hypothetical protein SGI83_15045 [Bacteroidota bacterium]|nr:hypothetical protein [Bacteroidota bacterium]
MQYPKRNFFSNQSAKLIPFCIVLLVYTGNTFAQKKDTIPAKRIGDVKTIITNRVLTTPPKDTVKPVDKRINNDNRIIKDVNIFKDTLKDRIIIQTRFPDTLTIGAYSIVVEAYDKGGTWDNNLKRYNSLDGTGYIKFNCPTSFVIWPGIWKGAILKPISYKVVNIKTKEDEISTQDVAALGLKAQPGEDVELMMPIINGRAIDFRKYITDLKAPKKFEGIRVRFTNISASVTKAGATNGLVISGSAAYPTDPATPPVPLLLSVASGFQLEISGIVFSPGVDPMLTAKLVLPTSLTQNSECAAGRLDLGSFRLGSSCEFYKVLAGSNYGVFGIGNTTLAIQGQGYVVDFSSSQTYPASGKPAAWKGVVLMQGESRGTTTSDVISNIGYLQAPYAFTNGIIENTGLTANFTTTASYGFGTTQPYGYTIEFPSASVNVAASAVAGGNIPNARVTLPSTAVRQGNNSVVALTDANLAIKPTMDLVGYALVLPAQDIYWGDLIAAGGGERKSFGVADIDRQAWIFFSARPRPMFNPTTPSGKKFSAPFTSLNPTVLDTYNMQGATFGKFTYLVVNTPDMPSSWGPSAVRTPATDNRVWYRLNKKDFCWINVVTEGVHCNIEGDIVDSPPLELGDPNKPLYVGVTPFKTIANIPGKNSNSFSRILLQCVESAVITCDYRSFIDIPEPVGNILAFKEMVFTSTANNAGGKLVVQANDSLAYWGLKLVPKPGFSSAGLISVKTGQVILNASGLAETRHFAQPFWLTWGEMLANGSMGRLFFDFNSAGQQFDKFNYIHNAVALSPIDPDPAKKGFLRVGGTAFFPFFGSDYLHIIDTYVPGMMSDPDNGRSIKLSTATTGSFLPSDLTIAGNWSDGLGIFNFDIDYATATQDGFLGTGMSSLRNLLGGDIGSTLDMSSRGTCIRIGTNLMDQRAVSLGPVANISNITRIWGCVCFKGDALENLVVGGEVTNAANVSIAARAGSYLSAILQVSPSLARVTVDGEAYMSVAAALDAVVNGHMQLTMNFAEGYLEGEVQGKIRVAEGAIFVGSSLEAEGQLNWHLGLDYVELQGMVTLEVMGFGGGAGIGAGFYIGKQAPKSRAWVLMGEDPRFNLNMAAMPNALTGVYGVVHIHQGINLFIISGSYDLYVGLGAFMFTGSDPIPAGALLPAIGLPYIVGNFGGRIHGEILGGLVSAGAYFNLQLIGPYPFSFEGTVGLEACVLWVICGSVDLTIGLNTSEGFYIR